MNFGEVIAWIVAAIVFVVLCLAIVEGVWGKRPRERDRKL